MNQPPPPTKNPLTIIAIFAGIIEASALASLPFLDDDSQSIYTWFLVGFPPFLTILFFLTLNFNSKSLYSPSDFSNEQDFLKVRDLVTNQDNGEPPPSRNDRQAISQQKLKKNPLPAVEKELTQGHQTVHIKSSFTALHIIDSRALKDDAHLSNILKATTPDNRQNTAEALELLIVLLTDVRTESSIDALLIDALHSETNKTVPSCTVAIYNLDTLALATLIRQKPDNQRHPP
ncbi:hypothetical protein D3C76_418670 [compost metagenome]